MRIYDISRTLSETIAVWPNDVPFRARWSTRIDQDSSVNVGAIAMSTHAGTHVDAPLHYQEDGAPIEDVDLETLVGPCYVVQITDVRAVTVRNVAMLDFTGVPRILFKTRSSDLGDDVFDEDFVHIEPAAIRYLSQRGVVLIGTDAPSVDAFNSAALPTHHELARAGIVNLENLYLRDVTPGLFHLTALPLKLTGLDAAPVRAILTPPPDPRGASH